jgi:glycosyltransferase involved in cell wall biosynthesis
MRIALVERFAWPRVGGIENVVRSLSAALAPRHAVEVFAHRIDDGPVTWRGRLDRTPPFASWVDADGIRTTQLRMTAADIAALAPFLVAPRRVGSRVAVLDRLSRGAEAWHTRVAGRRFAAQLDAAEIVHRFGGNRMALATVRAARRLDRPAVVTPFAHPGAWDDDPISAQAYRDADLVVATSRADADTYARLGVAANRLAVCPLPTPAPTRGGGEGLRRSGVITGPLILFLGARRSYKGVDALLAAASLLARRQPSAQVAFVGPGPSLGTDAPANVIDVGEVDDLARDAWLDAADIVCLPSANESWGLAVSEAWSVGAPVVTSDIPVLRERVEEAGGGIAVTPEPAALADALGTLLDDGDLRARMGRAGHEQYRLRLSPAAFAAWHEEAYTALVR